MCYGACDSGQRCVFAAAFSLLMGWLLWNLLGFGQDEEYDDVAVKKPDPEPDPEDAKTPTIRHPIMPLSRWEHREMIPLAHNFVRTPLRHFG